MDDAIGLGSGEHNSQNSEFEAGEVGSAGCIFTGPFRG